MNRMSHIFRLAVPALLLALAALGSQGGELARVELELTGLEEVSGDLYISVYDSDDTWLGEETVMRKKVVIEESRDGGTVRARLELPPGDYALSIYYDENDNGDLDTNFIGIPKEPVALSNNARPKFGPPKYKDAVFTLGSDTVVQRISMEDM